MFRKLRIAILLTILVVVGGRQLLTESRFSSWKQPLWVTIYPVIAGSAENIQSYTDGLTPESFRQIKTFIGQQAARHGRQLDTPVVIQVARPLTSLPPALPSESFGLSVALWSLKMRWWVWRNGSQPDLAAEDIRMFVLYQNNKPGGLLERSVGIKNGGYGVVNAVASRQLAARNRFVITHELMHILGASDKYDPATGQPVPPDGLANPSKVPLYPQQQAEIMAGRVAISLNRWRQPGNLKDYVIGDATATEIGW